MRHFVLIQEMNPYLATLFTFLIALAFLRLMGFFALRWFMFLKIR